jgi:hypothetical protein
LLVLDASPVEVPEVQSPVTPPKAISISERGEIRAEPKASSFDVEEDPIDRELHKVDGWVSLTKGDSKETKLDDFIAVRVLYVPR